MELEEEGSEVERFRSRIAELEREKQMMVYENHASRVEARVKELEVELASEVKRRIMLTNSYTQEKGELEAELAGIKARTCKTCAHWYDEYQTGFATCAKWSVYSLPADPKPEGTHYAKTGKDGFCYLWAEIGGE